MPSCPRCPLFWPSTHRCSESSRTTCVVLLADCHKFCSPHPLCCLLLWETSVVGSWRSVQVLRPALKHMFLGEVNVVPRKQTGADVCTFLVGQQGSPSGAGIPLCWGGSTCRLMPLPPPPPLLCVGVPPPGGLLHCGPLLDCYCQWSTAAYNDSLQFTTFRSLVQGPVRKVWLGLWFLYW